LSYGSKNELNEPLVLFIDRPSSMTVGSVSVSKIESVFYHREANEGEEEEVEVEITQNRKGIGIFFLSLLLCSFPLPPSSHFSI